VVLSFLNIENSNIVIGLNLCPFAHRAYVDKQVGFKCVNYEEETFMPVCMAALQEMLDEQTQITTNLLIFTKGLEDFDVYLENYYWLEAALEEVGLHEEVQLASFHPQYRFDGTEEGDVQNYTNRSPYPIIHFLKVTEVARAVEGHPDVKGIPERNIARMRELGLKHIKNLYFS